MKILIEIFKALLTQWKIVLSIIFIIAITKYVILPTYDAFEKKREYYNLEVKYFNKSDSLKNAIKTIILLESSIDTAKINLIDCRGNLKVYTDNSGSYQKVAKQCCDSSHYYKDKYFRLVLETGKEIKSKKRRLF